MKIMVKTSKIQKVLLKNGNMLSETWLLRKTELSLLLTRELKLNWSCKKLKSTNAKRKEGKMEFSKWLRMLLTLLKKKEQLSLSFIILVTDIKILEAG